MLAMSEWEPIVFPEHALLIVKERLREQHAEGVRPLARSLIPPLIRGFPRSIPPRAAPFPAGSSERQLSLLRLLR
jgi:hypothetical protein